MNLTNLYHSGETRKEGDWLADEYKLFFVSGIEDSYAELFVPVSG